MTIFPILIAHNTQVSPVDCEVTPSRQQKGVLMTNRCEVCVPATVVSSKVSLPACDGQLLVHHCPDALDYLTSFTTRGNARLVEAY